MATRKRAATKNAAMAADIGDYITIDGQRIRLVEHETDFNVLAAAPPVVRDAVAGRGEAVALNRDLSRVRMAAAADRDPAMEDFRAGRNIASHIYIRPDTGEELTFNKRVIVKLKANDPSLIESIAGEFHLRPVGTQGDEHVLELMPSAVENPLKIANRISQKDGVDYAQPEQLVDIELHAAPLLFARQWYLSSALSEHPDVLPDSGIDCTGAWNITRGDREVVVAVVDDGFQLQHPCFTGKTIHAAARDYAGADTDPRPGQRDYHGTPVASIATGSDLGGAMTGVAPGCTFLPIRIGFGGGSAAPYDILDVFRLASAHADVVNCSFGHPPRATRYFTDGWMQELTTLTRFGGRRGKGLAMVFSAANDDAPTYLPASRNVGGVRYTQRDPLTGSMRVARVPPGYPVYTGYPLVPGVIVVGSSSSRKRKSGYSNWGPHISVVAPSNNGHYIMEFVPPGDPDRAPFVASYPGLGQVAATNRGLGRPFDPLADDPLTAQVREDDYTAGFGGTSGAAPVITGVVALMLSVNPDLTAAQVKNILENTADQNLDTALDLAGDPNIIPNTTAAERGFVNGRSILFGAGRVNARRAVERARDLYLAAHPQAEPVLSAAAQGSDAGVLQNLQQMFCLIHGVSNGQLVISGLSSSPSNVCSGGTTFLPQSTPRTSTSQFCRQGNETLPIWKVFIA